MARGSQAALVALNRFGLGARGGASANFVNAASDPRGFVKADLSRSVLLDAPGLQSTPALAATVFAYQFEIVQARNAAAKSGAPAMAAPTDIAGKAAAMEAKDANAAIPEAMQPDGWTTRSQNAQHSRHSCDSLGRAGIVATGAV